MRAPPPPDIQLLDLKDLSRPGASTTIYLDTGYQGSVPWIECGQIEINAPNQNRDTSIVNVRGPEGWTDFEHDTIKVASFELVSLKFEGLWGGVLVMKGYLAPDPEDLRIPTPEWIKGVKESASKCPTCKRKESHMMVDEGFYVPKPDPVLFEKIRRYRVEIRSQITVNKDK